MGVDSEIPHPELIPHLFPAPFLCWCSHAPVEDHDETFMAHWCSDFCEAQGEDKVVNNNINDLFP